MKLPLGLVFMVLAAALGADELRHHVVVIELEFHDYSPYTILFKNDLQQ